MLLTIFIVLGIIVFAGTILGWIGREVAGAARGFVELPVWGRIVLAVAIVGGLAVSSRNDAPRNEAATRARAIELCEKTCVTLFPAPLARPCVEGCRDDPSASPMRP